jgi:tRNA(Arg) A34 adenosine deaminase TadA
MQKKSNELKFMRKAIALSARGVERGGGPFGAVIVKEGKIVASASNQVTLNNDPTAHAEVLAIRKACKKLKTFDLSDCELYTSCEPCPMCLAAIYWARINRYYFANAKEDACKIGFDDAFIYSELDKPSGQRSIQQKQMLREEALTVFNNWENKENKVEY